MFLSPIRTETFNSYKTNKYKLHYYETSSGIRFALTTDNSVGDLKEHLKHIHSQIFVEFVIKNPFYKQNSVVRCSKFEASLDKYIRNMFCFN